eukprot:jgi/Chlat1/2887/Chrsp2S04653
MHSQGQSSMGEVSAACSTRFWSPGRLQCTLLLLAALASLLLLLARPAAAAAEREPQPVRATSFADLAKAVRTQGASEVHVLIAGNITADATLAIAANARLTVRADSSSRCRCSIAAAANFKGALFTVPKSATLSLLDLEFTRFHTLQNEAVVVNTGELVVERCAFSANRFRGPKGAAAVYTQGNASLSHCEFNSNSVKSDEYAGAISTFGSTIITHCKFVNNAGAGGSAIYSKHGHLHVDASSFRNNHAIKTGSAISVYNGSADIKRSSFAGNYAGGEYDKNFNGGIISMYGKRRGGNAPIVRIHDCNFLGKPLLVFGLLGGCLGISGMTVEIRRTNFSQCSAATRGAVFYSFLDTVLVIEDSNFIDNDADQGGVGFNEGGNVTVRRSNIVATSASLSGGAFYNTGIMLIDSSSITGSQARGSCTSDSDCFAAAASGSGGWGGAVINYVGGNLSAINSQFSNNTAVVSGGAYYGSDGSGITIFDGCKFIGNHADRDAGGGVLTQTQMNITHSTFKHNFAQRGGGAIHNNASACLHDVKFSDNAANISGGAVHNFGVMNVSSSVFRRNHAKRSCGDIRNDAVRELELIDGVPVHTSSRNALTISHCDFKNSSANGEGGSVCNFLGILTLSDSVISGAHADIGGAVYVGGDIAIIPPEVCGNMSTLLQNVNLTDNNASASGGGIAIDASACDSAARITFANSNIIRNTAASGGGATTSCGAAGPCPHIVAVMFRDNKAERGGGGALFCGSSDLPNITCPDGNNTISLQASDGCDAWEGNEATDGGYGNVMATSARYLQASQTNFSDVVSVSALPNLTVSVHDQFGQVVSSGPNASLALQATLLSNSSQRGARFVSPAATVASGGVAKFALALQSIPGINEVAISTPEGLSTRIHVEIRACIPGEHTNPEGDRCEDCTQPSYRQGSALVVVNDGYWQSALLVDQFVQCLNEKACSYTKRNDSLKEKLANRTWKPDDQCAQGYNGNLCAVCRDGYGLSGQAGSLECKRCGMKSLTALALTGLTLISVLAIVLIIRSASQLPFEAIDEERMTLGMMVPAIVKLLVSYLQVNSIAFGVQFRWPSFMSHLIAAVASVSTIGGELLSPNCLLGNGNRFDTSFQVMIVFAALPFVATALPALFWTARWHYLRVKQSLTLTLSMRGLRASTFGEYFQPRFALSVIAVQFFLWPAVTTRIVTLFSCRNVNTAGSYVPESAVGSFWERAMNQRCYEGVHMAMVAIVGIPGAIIFCVGIPLVTFIILYRKRKFLYMQATAKYYGFLYAGYKRKFFYWECVVCLQKLALILVRVFMSQLGTDYQILVSLGLTWVFTLMSRAAAPFASEKLCNMQTIAWASSCVLLYMAWLFFLPLSEALRLVLSIAFGFIYLGSILLFLVLLSTEITTGIRKQKLNVGRREHIAKDDIADALREAVGPVAGAVLGTGLVALHSVYNLTKQRSQRYMSARRLSRRATGLQYESSWERADPSGDETCAAEATAPAADVVLSGVSNEKQAADSPQVAPMLEHQSSSAGTREARRCSIDDEETEGVQAEQNEEGVNRLC